MKKQIIFIGVSVIIAVLLILNVFLFNKVSNQEEIIQSLDEVMEIKEEERSSLISDNNKLNEELTTSEKELVNIKLDLDKSNQELAQATELIEQIDKMLEGNGVTIVKIEELLSTNEKLEAEVAKLMTLLDEIKEESLKAEEAEEKDQVISEPDQDLNPVIQVPINEWSQDLTTIIDAVEKRKSELSAAADTLPTLSLERIMINQEVEVLDSFIVDLQELKDTIENF